MSSVKRVSQIVAAALALAAPMSTMASGPAIRATPVAVESCPARSLLLSFDVYRFGTHLGQAPIWRLGTGPAFYFESGFLVDADGAPNAYNADNTGLDDLSNAGEPGGWDGIIQNEDGEPAVQGPDDPFPGYYISCTSLFDPTKHHRDPARFVNATEVPYVALPHDLAAQTGTKLGDLVFVVNRHTGQSAWAIFADMGAFGEGSIALAENLGINSDARRGGTPTGISYVVFPGSGDGQPKSADQIDMLGEALLGSAGGLEDIGPCAGNAAEDAEAVVEDGAGEQTPAAQRSGDEGS